MLNSTIKISNYRFQVKEILLIFTVYFFAENIFSWLFIPNSLIVNAYEKLISMFAYLVVLYKFNQLKLAEKIYVGLFTFIMVRLVIVSLYTYNTFFQQLTMFTVLAPMMYVIFIKSVCRTLDFDILGLIAKFYLFTYIVFMAVYGRGFSFSLATVEMDDYGPFSGDSRVIHARSIFTLIIPLIWFLHEYITKRKFKFLIPFIICFAAILIHQHRSVWSSAIIALCIYLWASIRNRNVKVPALVSIFISGLIVTMVAIFFISNMAPGFIDFIVGRFSEILDPSQEGGTGSFRFLQRETYFELFKQHPVFGWTFEGFEMPNPLVDWWPEKTGQHFHEGYIEMLFYHGIVGLALKYSFLIYFVFKIFSKKLSSESIILMSFCLSGLVFSFSYVLPLVFWGHVGLTLYYLEKKNALVLSDNYSPNVLI